MQTTYKTCCSATRSCSTPMCRESMTIRVRRLLRKLNQRRQEPDGTRRTTWPILLTPRTLTRKSMRVDIPTPRYRHREPHSVLKKLALARTRMMLRTLQKENTCKVGDTYKNTKVSSKTLSILLVNGVVFQRLVLQVPMETSGMLPVEQGRPPR